jgi:glycosyltransferase involved in cell wall biosynthesis
MKIAILGGYAPSLLGFRGPMMSAFIKHGHSVTGIAPDASDKLVEKLKKIGVSYKSIVLNRTSTNPFGDIKSYLSIKNALREIKPDIVLSYTIKPVIYGSIAALKEEVPHRYSMITGLGSSLIGRGFKGNITAFMVRQLYRYGLAGNEGIFFQNDDDRAFFNAHKMISTSCRVTVINGSGVDLDRYKPAPIPDGEIVFIMIARITKDKGVVEYVEAARIIKKKQEKARFLLVGPFDTNPSAIKKEEVGEWEREGIIQYCGAVEDVRPLLAKAHVLVLPSYGEGTPHAVLEAMAMGRPIITTMAPGCKETVISGTNGFLVPVRNSIRVAEAMKNFIDNRQLINKMGCLSRDYAESRYDVNKVNEMILKAMRLL